MCEKDLNHSAPILLLVDQTTSINKINKIIQTNLIHKIISFDYESHELLNNNKIPHEISDNFVTRAELIYIQNKCYGYTKWYENNQLNPINYEGINLGSLIQVELNYFLVGFVKKFFEIIKIFNQYSSAKFFASSMLFEFIKLHTNSAVSIDSTKSNNVFYYDKLKIPLPIGKHNFSISLSVNQFIRLRRMFDIFTSFLLGPYKLDISKKSILIVEFNPVRYKKLFEHLRNVPINFMLFNRRNPAIWNFQSFSVIKKSKCNVINDLTFKVNDSHYMKKTSSEINSKIQSLWINDSFFQSFFSINGISFWTALKPMFNDLFTKRAIESIRVIDSSKKIFQKYDLNSILLWSEIGSTEQILIKLAKKFGIKIILLQHGLFYDSASESAYRMNEFQGVYPKDADKYVLWGEIERKHQIKRGTPNEKLVVIGAPLYDEVSMMPENDDRDYVLLATSGPVKENTLDLTIETIEKNQKAIKKICEVVSKMNKKLVIKLHPSQDEYDPSELIRKINPNIIIKKRGSISQLAKSCDVFIVIDVSTVILDAHLLKKPVISVLVKDSDYGIPSIVNRSCLLADIDSFELTLEKILTDENLRKSMIEKGLLYAKEYLANHGSASIKLLEFLNDI